MKRIDVNLEAAASYTIGIGRDILATMADEVAAARWAARYAVITDANVAPLHLASVLTALQDAGLDAAPVVLPAGEEHKTMDTVVSLASTLMEMGLDRTSGLIALGGGVVGDLTGFAASIYMRGIPVIQLPTTLLAQVDAGIGGKTGVDVPAAKNILGTFHQPRLVCCDLALLDTLPPRQWTNGCAEVIKYGVIADPEILTLTERLGAGDPEVVADVVARSCRIKAAIVEDDEREGDRRRILNFGHTVGHAIEAESRYTILHGEAVAMGMVCAGRLSQVHAHLSGADCDQIVDAIRRVGLPHRIPAGIAVEGLLDRITRDKKKAGSTVHFVLVEALGRPIITGSVTPAEVRDAIREVTA